MNTEIDEQISRFINKSALLGDRVEIEHSGNRIKLLRYDTKSSSVVLPDFINYVENLAIVFGNSESVKSVTLSPLSDVCLSAAWASSIEELIINQGTKSISDIQTHGELKLVLNGDIRICTNSIRNINKLSFINSEYISQINYYGIRDCTIESITIEPHILTPNSIVKCKIKELHLSHGQERLSFRNTLVFHMYYYIEKKHYEAFNRDDLAITKYIREELFFNSTIGTIEIVVR